MPDESAQSETGRNGWLTTLGWAAYLACSWTWCIGMFLPVLLVRDYGVWGFVAFAVPNVVGAAAMGWMRAGVSERVVHLHWTAIQAFSIVTITFQFFFVFWMLAWRQPGSEGTRELLVLLIMPLGTILWFAMRSPGRAPLVAATAVLLFSFAVFAAATPSLLDVWRHQPLLSSASTPRDLIWLFPVIAFGFGLCPYLDATFHRARRSETSTQARASFAIGFGVFFLACILFTLVYAPSIWRILRGGSDRAPWFELLVFMYIVVQLSFTIDAHTAQSVPPSRVDPRPFYLTLLGLAVACALGIISFAWTTPIRGLLPGELIYRLFMSFYGLVFPAYVWVCMIPTRDGHSGPRRDKVVAWMAAVLIAAPMFWMGFIERRTVWLVPGLAVVLLARLGVMWGRASVGEALPVTGGPGHDGGGGGRTVS